MEVEAEFRFAEAVLASAVVVDSLVLIASNDNGKVEKFHLQSYTFV